MRILDWGSGGDPLGGARCVATIGVFDGLHLGHRALVDRVVAQAPRLLPLAVTFRSSPKMTTSPSRFKGDIFTLGQKLAALEEAGIEACVLIDFSGNFSKLAGSEFVSALVGSYGVRSFVIGSDFKCGHRLSTDARALADLATSLGAVTDIVGPVLYDGVPVSSSRIRSAIAEGRTDLASAMLGRPYTYDLRGLEFTDDGSTASVIMRHSGLVEPAVGRYSATVTVDSKAYAVEAVFERTGRLSWPSCGASGVEFLALDAKVA